MTRISMASLLADGTVTVTSPAKPPPKRMTKRRPPTDKTVILAKQHRELARLDALHNTLAEKAGTLIDEVATMKDVSEAAGALERLGRITDRLIALERQAHGLDRPMASQDAEFATLLKKAWERAYGTSPPDLA